MRAQIEHRLYKRLSLVDTALPAADAFSPSPGTIKHSSGGYRFLEQGGHHGGKGTYHNRRRYSYAHEAGSGIGTCFGEEWIVSTLFIGATIAPLVLPHSF